MKLATCPFRAPKSSEAARGDSQSGCERDSNVDVRVIAATHRDLHQGVKEGWFREDLLYRLEVVTLRVPSLRERPQDLECLIQAFVGEACVRHGKRLKGVDEALLARLRAHSWPGNVRELKNVIERAVILAKSHELGLQDLPAHLRETVAARRPGWWKRSDACVKWRS